MKNPCGSQYRSTQKYWGKRKYQKNNKENNERYKSRVIHDVSKPQPFLVHLDNY
jgi:hypothetical protein